MWVQAQMCVCQRMVLSLHVFTCKQFLSGFLLSSVFLVFLCAGNPAISGFSPPPSPLFQSPTDPTSHEYGPAQAHSHVHPHARAHRLKHACLNAYSLCNHRDMRQALNQARTYCTCSHPQAPSLTQPQALEQSPQYDCTCACSHHKLVLSA